MYRIPGFKGDDPAANIAKSSHPTGRVSYVDCIGRWMGQDRIDTFLYRTVPAFHPCFLFLYRIAEWLQPVIKLDMPLYSSKHLPPSLQPPRSIWARTPTLTAPLAVYTSELYPTSTREPGGRRPGISSGPEVFPFIK
jgi:hypothetical protein